MSNRSVRGHGNSGLLLPRRPRALRSSVTASSDGAAFVIFNAEDAFVHPSEFTGPKYTSKARRPLPPVRRTRREGVPDTDPVLLPADAAVATDEADPKVTGYPAARACAARRVATNDRTDAGVS